MLPSQSSSSSTSLRHTFTPVWSLSTFASPRGLSLAREKGWVLVWDEKYWLYLINTRGERQAQVRTPGPLAAACCADDGSCCAAVGNGGEVWWLAPDLTLRWERKIRHPTVAVALDPFGQYLAVADTRGGLSLFDRHGQRLWEIHTPRPLHRLAFIPEAPLLVGCADFGLLMCLDQAGKVLWRDGLVVHCGSLATSGSGDRIVLACYSDGLRCYGSEGTKLPQVTLGESCRLAVLSFDGRLTLVAGRSNRVLMLDTAGRVLGLHVLERPAVALGLAPLGDWAIAALVEGGVVALHIPREITL